MRHWRKDDPTLNDLIVHPQPWDAQLRRSSAAPPGSGSYAANPSAANPSGGSPTDHRGPNPYTARGHASNPTPQRWDQTTDDQFDDQLEQLADESELPSQYRQLARQQAMAVQQYQKSKNRPSSQKTPLASSAQRSADANRGGQDKQSGPMRYSLRDDDPQEETETEPAAGDSDLYADTGVDEMFSRRPNAPIEDLKAPPRQASAHLSASVYPVDTGAGDEVRVLPHDTHESDRDNRSSRQLTNRTVSREPTRRNQDRSNQDHRLEATPGSSSSASDRENGGVQPASGQRPVKHVPVELPTSPGNEASLARSRPQQLTSRDHLLAAIAALNQEWSEDMTPSEQLLHQAKERWVHMALEQLGDAMEPIEGLEQSEQDFMRYSLQAWHDATDPKGNPVLARRRPLVLNSLREAATRLASNSPLEVKHAAFCSNVDGFGSLTPFPTTQFQPGQELLLYCEIDNFVSEQVKDGYETKLQGNYEIVDGNGVRVADVLLPQEVDICKRSRRDYFFVYRIYMPQKIDAGRYQLRLTIEDMKGKKFGQTSLGFQIASN